MTLGSLARLTSPLYFDWLSCLAGVREETKGSQLKVSDSTNESNFFPTTISKIIALEIYCLLTDETKEKKPSGPKFQIFLIFKTHTLICFIFCRCIFLGEVIKLGSFFLYNLKNFAFRGTTVHTKRFHQQSHSTT